MPITAATAPQAVPDIALAPSTPHPSGHASTGLPAEVTAALGSGVTVHTLDDSFSLTIRARMQVRATLLTAANGSMDLPATEFQIRRARLLLQGHFFAREFQYYLQLGFSNQDTEPDLRLPLRDAYITWTRAA